MPPALTVDIDADGAGLRAAVTEPKGDDIVLVLVVMVAESEAVERKEGIRRVVEAAGVAKDEAEAEAEAEAEVNSKLMAESSNIESSSEPGVSGIKGSLVGDIIMPAGADELTLWEEVATT